MYLFLRCHLSIQVCSSVYQFVRTSVYSYLALHHIIQNASKSWLLFKTHIYFYATTCIKIKTPFTGNKKSFMFSHKHHGYWTGICFIHYNNKHSKPLPQLLLITTQQPILQNLTWPAWCGSIWEQLQLLPSSGLSFVPLFLSHFQFPPLSNKYRDLICRSSFLSLHYFLFLVSSFTSPLFLPSPTFHHPPPPQSPHLKRLTCISLIFQLLPKTVSTGKQATSNRLLVNNANVSCRIWWTSDNR